MRPIQLSPQTPEQLEALDALYRTSRDVRLRQRAQVVLLAAEKGLVAAEIGGIVRLSEESVRRWLKRYEAEGIEGLKDAPRPGMAPVVTREYRTQLVETWSGDAAQFRATLFAVDASAGGLLSGEDWHSRERRERQALFGVEGIVLSVRSTKSAVQTWNMRSKKDGRNNSG
jgi:transposase